MIGSAALSLAGRYGAQAQEPGISPRILIVDDILDNRAVLSRRLVRRGYEIVEAESAEQAKAALNDQRFDLMLLDVMMPGQSGLDLLSEIRQATSSCELPIIMVTAKSYSEDVVDALQRGADDYITKPVDFEVALARINSQLERKRSAERRLREVGAGAVAARPGGTECSAAQARYLASIDPLTGLLNRGHLVQEMQPRVESHAGGGPAYTAIFIDLDRFKAANDTFGHAAGDEVLRIVSTRIKALLRPDDLLARMGGDEFLVIHLRVPGHDDSLALARSILAEILKPCVVGPNEIGIGASIGVAAPRTINEPPEKTIANADLGMYQAKRSGGDRVTVFDADMAEAELRRRELEHDFCLALNRGELTLHYQPIFDLKDHKIVCCEALVRWTHPRHGAIAPSEFLPIAQESGLIMALGQWVVRQACETALAWPSSIRIAVNLCASQLEQEDLVTTVAQSLAATGLEPGRLMLEISEAVFKYRSARALSTLKQLRRLGVRIALDDFGAGLSNLAQWRDYGFECIKFNQGLVRRMAFDESAMAIVSSIAGLAKTLGLDTVAKGIETENDLVTVRQVGVDQMQGFFFGRPLNCAGANEAITSLNEAG